MASRFRLLTFLTVLCAALHAQGADDVSSVDLRVVVDVSAAMQVHDPDNLRGGGIEFLIRSLPDDARAGIWSFAQHTTKVAQYGRADALWKQIASIHVASLESHGAEADLPGALQAAAGDLGRKDRSPVHLVLFSSGDIRTGKGQAEDEQVRLTLLAEWVAKLRQARVHVHTIGIMDEDAQASADGDLPLLRQLAQASGGLHRVIADQQQMQDALLDVQQRLTVQPQAQLDAAGRFQVAPGAQRMTVLWFAGTADTTPQLKTPGGNVLDRLTALDNGRWLLSPDFEMVTLHDPQPGWWQVQGPLPDTLSVYGEIDIRVAGISGTVVPTDESNVEITLFSQGLPIRHADFLDLLDVRAWVVNGGDRRPLPIDRHEDVFVAHFVNLDDGAHELEVSVVAPTFARSVIIPFVVSNPLLVEVRQQPGEEAVAWVQFSHAQVNYASLKTTAMVRRPPKIATLIPAQRMPAGLWRIPLGHRQGIVEVTFSAAGNYLDGKGVILKTQPHALTLPLAAGTTLTLTYDAQGKLISAPEDDLYNTRPAQSGVVAGPAGSDGKLAAPPAPDGEIPADVPGAAQAAVPEASLPLIPLWFVALISALNLVIGGLIWWLNKLKPLPFAPA